MIRYTSLLKSSIFNFKKNIKKDEEMGKVVDLVFSNNLHKITNLIGENGKLIKTKWLIPFDTIVTINDKGVLVNKDSCLKIEDFNREKLITGEDVKIIEKSVLQEDGELIGYVKDVIINPLNGILIGFIMTEGIFEEIFKGRNFIPNMGNIKINSKNIIINDAIMDQIVKNKEYYKKLLELENS